MHLMSVTEVLELDQFGEFIIDTAKQLQVEKI